MAEDTFDEHDIRGCYLSEETRDFEIGPVKSTSFSRQAFPYSGDFELKTGFVAAVERSLNVRSGELSEFGKRTDTYERERVVAAGAIRNFAALFYQAFGPLDPDDPDPGSMQWISSRTLLPQWPRRQRDYVTEVLREPEAIIASGGGSEALAERYSFQRAITGNRLRRSWHFSHVRQPVVYNLRKPSALLVSQSHTLSPILAIFIIYIDISVSRLLIATRYRSTLNTASTAAVGCIAFRSSFSSLKRH